MESQEIAWLGFGAECAGIHRFGGRSQLPLRITGDDPGGFWRQLLSSSGHGDGRSIVSSRNRPRIGAGSHWSQRWILYWAALHWMAGGDAGEYLRGRRLAPSSA